MIPQINDNPAALKAIARFVAPQPIVPGSGRYDYVKNGGQGRALPLVGNYPSGAPGMTVSPSYGLGDDMSAPDSDSKGVMIAAGLVAVLAGLYWISEKFPL